jgi:hypothetical protein
MSAPIDPLSVCFDHAKMGRPRFPAVTMMLLRLCLALAFLGARGAEVSPLTPLIPSNFYSVISREAVMVSSFVIF